MTVPARVLVVDDSAMMRTLLSDLLASSADLAVVGSAPNPAAAREMIKRLSPDVLTLDVEMPGMHGLDFLERLMALRPMPVVMVSAFSGLATDTALEALRIGAVDVVAKPRSLHGVPLEAFRTELVTKVRNAASARPRAAPAPGRGTVSADGDPWALVAIGASTGGVEVIGSILASLPEDAPPIVIVQHMPEGFTNAFARRLNRVARVSVQEARHGVPVLAGQASIAPGARQLTVRGAAGSLRIELADGPKVSGHKPSVDVLFDAVARLNLRDRVLGILLTGMGSDGAAGLLALRESGGFTVGQDAASCVVHGMPRAAAAAGAVAVELTPSQIVACIAGGRGEPARVTGRYRIR